MHKPGSVLENDTHKPLWDFDRQTDHRISARRQKTKQKRELARLWTLLSRLTTELYRKKVKRISTSTLLGNRKTMEHEGDNYTNRDWCFWYNHQRIIKELEDLEIRGRVEVLLNDYWKLPEYWEESWRLVETCCHSNSSERPSVLADGKNSQGVNNNNNNELKHYKMMN